MQAKIAILARYMDHHRVLFCFFNFEESFVRHFALSVACRGCPSGHNAKHICTDWEGHLYIYLSYRVRIHKSQKTLKHRGWLKKPEGHLQESNKNR